MVFPSYSFGIDSRAFFRQKGHLVEQKNKYSGLFPVVFTQILRISHSLRDWPMRESLDELEFITVGSPGSAKNAISSSDPGMMKTAVKNDIIVINASLDHPLSGTLEQLDRSLVGKIQTDMVKRDVEIETVGEGVAEMIRLAELFGEMQTKAEDPGLRSMHKIELQLHVIHGVTCFGVSSTYAFSLVIILSDKGKQAWSFLKKMQVSFFLVVYSSIKFHSAVHESYKCFSRHRWFGSLQREVIYQQE
ncbi:hypothetical protein Tco_0260862 [Tanacetum coccineum]